MYAKPVMNDVIRHVGSAFCANKFVALVTLPEEIFYILADDKRSKTNFNFKKKIKLCVYRTRRKGQ